MVDLYQPQLIWFDWWIEEPAFVSVSPRFAAYYYNRGEEWGRGVAINYKHHAFPEGTAVYDIERGQLAGIRPQFWQTDTSVAKNSWGYVSQQDYKTAGSIVGDLVDIVSKNGALLLNIGPRPDGTISEPEEAMLRDIGRWLSVNGEAIYGTRPWTVFGEGPTEIVEGEFKDTVRQSFTSQDIRFTTKENALYAICLDWPDTEVTVRSLASGAGMLSKRITEVSLLGSATTLSWSLTEDGLSIQTPDERPCDNAYAFKIVLNDA